MEECCAVCAEPLIWVAYGPCSHLVVCYECTAKMRVVMEDSRCCICKQDCPSVYVTKACGDFTKMVTDFDSLGEEVRRKDKGGTRLYYEDSVQAYFDDEEPFRRIKAMCRLSCRKCEECAPPPPDEPLPKGAVKKGHIFKSIESLRRHLFQSHKLIMCELCLQGRKVFVCEQNLFSRSQLDRHSEKGDSEVDGTEEERGGFTGHPMCEFCRKRFYGEHELYQHMTQEHYTCHICLRARPGHFEYYRNYDDLEMHFRDKHTLCEHPDCLNKKFIVFVSEAELKRHNATTHGGSMSRSQRNAALQIPVAIEFRRSGQASGDGGRNSSSNSNSRGHGRGRGRRGNVQFESEGLDAAVQASVEQAILDDAVRESAAMAASATESDTREGQNSFAALSESETESLDADAPALPSRYASAVSGTGPSTLADSAFPPLPGGNSRGKNKAKNQKGPASMAALLGGGSGGGRGGGVRVLNTAGSRHLSAGSSSSRPSSANGDSNLVGGTWAASNSRPSTSSEVRPAGGWTSVSPSRRSQGRNNLEPEAFPVIGAGSSSAVIGRAAAVDSGGNGNHSRARSDTPVAASGKNVDVVHQLSREELRAGNVALIENIRAGLRGNEQAFADFKDVSLRFSKGELNTLAYYGHITRLGLSRIVPELGRLCPDPVKGKELIEAHASQMAREQEFPPVASSSSSSGTSQVPKSGSSGAGKGKGEAEGSGRPSQSSGRLSSQLVNEEVEVLSRDGYRSATGKSKIREESSSGASRVSEGGHESGSRGRKPQVLVKASTSGSSVEPVADLANEQASKIWVCDSCTLVNRGDSPKCEVCGTDGPSGVQASGSGRGADTSGNDKRKKKISKFQRVRLGDGSAAALLDSVANPNPWGVISDVGSPAVPAPAPAVEVRAGFGRGAWANGGGSRLMSNGRRN